MDQLSLAFSALADPTRRDLVARLAVGDATVGELAAPYDMSVQAVSKHVAVLERAGLVGKERRGREQLVRTDTVGVERARRALAELEATWHGRVQRMTEVLAHGAGPPRTKATTKGRK